MGNWKGWGILAVVYLLFGVQLFYKANGIPSVDIRIGEQFFVLSLYDILITLTVYSTFIAVVQWIFKRRKIQINVLMRGLHFGLTSFLSFLLIALSQFSGLDSPRRYYVLNDGNSYSHFTHLFSILWLSFFAIQLIFVFHLLISYIQVQSKIPSERTDILDR